MAKKLDDVIACLPEARQRRIEARAMELAPLASVDYEAFLKGKIEAARQSVTDGQGPANAEVEALFATRRAELTSGT